MDTIGEDGTGSKENCRQAEGTSWEKQIQPFCSSLEKLPPSPRKEDVRSHDEGHVSKGGGFRVSVFSVARLFEDRRDMRHSQK